MATKKPIKRGYLSKPNPRAEPGAFIIRGKAWFDEHGVMVIDENGDIPYELEDSVRYGDFLYRVGEYRENDRIPHGTTASYELRWCPVLSKKVKAKSKNQ